MLNVVINIYFINIILYTFHIQLIYSWIWYTFVELILEVKTNIKVSI